MFVTAIAFSVKSEVHVLYMYDRDAYAYAYVSSSDRVLPCANTPVLC